MTLPGGDKAVVHRQRLLAYNLLLTHRVGGPKARVFKSALGLTAADADELIMALRRAAAQNEAVERYTDDFGTRFRIDFLLEFRGRSRMLRSGWLIRQPGARPEFMSVWVL